MEILQVPQAWMPLFLTDTELLDLLYSSIINVEQYLQRDDAKPMIPHRSKLLRPLSRCPPKDVKVVLLGHDPIPHEKLATGFAFSFPAGEFSDEKFKRVYPRIPGLSLAVLHEVLVDAGYLERGADYDGCHEEWADRGVLLLNAALTYTFGILTHFDLWKDFICRLLCLVAHHSQQQPIFFLS